MTTQKKQNKLLQVLKIIGFIVIGFFLFWLVYKDQDIEQLKKSLYGANYWWLIVSMTLGLISHFSRALRWKLLIDPLGYKSRPKTLFYSVLIMYLSNLAIPRSGEVVRCSITSRYEKIPFTSLLGTVVIERIVDVITLLLLTIVVVLTQFSVIVDFFNKNTAAQETITKLTESTSFIIIISISIILIIGLIIFFRKKIQQTKIYKKFQKIIEDFVAGIKSIANLEHKWRFIAHSLFIWTMYFVMIYVAFFAFDFTKDYGLLVGLTAFVMASYGMVFPSPGGIGTWHFMVIETLVIYGLGRTNASAFAFAAHSSQTAMLIVAGLASLIATSILKVQNSKIENNNITNT